MKMNDMLVTWSVTDCAECLSNIPDALHGILWSFHDDDKNSFRETPDFDSSNGNLLSCHWDKLEENHREILNLAIDRYPE